MLTDRFDQALAFAARLHRDQRREGTDISYVSHLLSVCALALENGADEDQAIAALLHDTVGDQDATVEDIAARFGAPVAAIVRDCTDGEPADRADGRWRRGGGASAPVSTRCPQSRPRRCWSALPTRPTMPRMMRTAAGPGRGQDARDRGSDGGGTGTRLSAARVRRR